MVKLGIGSGGADGVGRELDAGDGIKVGREQDGKEAAAAIRIDEMGGLVVCIGICGKDGVTDIIGEGYENGIVVLEKGVTGKLKVGVADAFADGCLVISDAHVLVRVVWGSGIDGEGGVEGVAEEEGDALFVRPNVSVRVSVGRGEEGGWLTG